MLRTRFAALLASLFLLHPLSAQTTDPCIGGRARGAWDLPAADHGGRVRGLLGDGTGRRWMLEARLAPGELVDGLRGGRMDGVLTPVTPDGTVLKPIAEVHGVFTVLPDRTGRFESAIFELADGTPEPQEVLGKLTGAFADPNRAGTDPVGRFVGRWAMCR